MKNVPRASKSLRAYVRNLKAAARREGRPKPSLRYNEARQQWEIVNGPQTT